MKTLYLVRHGKSDWQAPVSRDDQRPLNQRGLDNAPKMGLRIKEKNIQPDLMLSSPAVRAMTTAILIAEVLGIEEQAIQQEPLIYNASLEELLQVVQGLPDSCNGVMLFGHNPGFTELANYLGDVQVGNMPTCSIYAVSFALDTWQAVNQGLGTCQWFDYPKKGEDISR